jgi:hypothetical protein
MPLSSGRVCGRTVNQRFRETRNLDVAGKRVNRIVHRSPEQMNRERQVEPMMPYDGYADSVKSR